MIFEGSNDGTVRVWDVETGRCLKVWEFGESIQHVAWNPLPDLPLLAVSVYDFGLIHVIISRSTVQIFKVNGI